MVTYGFVIDNRKCIGCHACTVACKAEHDVPIGVNRTWVKYIEKGEFPFTKRTFSVMRCNHCTDAPCVEICPVTALYTRPDGIVDFDNQRCIGCKACTQACPYDAIYLDPYDQTAAKCNYCSHRVDVGLAPPCVTVCPTHAILCGNLDDPNSEIARHVAREAVQVRKPEKGTEPKLFYLEGDTLSLDPLAAIPENSYMWSQGEPEPEPGVLSWPSPSSDSSGKLRGKIVRTLGHVAKRVYDPPRERVVWGTKVSGYILTKAIAAGAFAIPLLAFGPGTPTGALGQVGAWLGLLFLALTGYLLVKDLRRMDRFLYVLFRPQWKSWLVRGGYILMAFGLVIVLWLIGGVFDPEFQAGLAWPGVVLSFLSAVYTAFLLAQAKGRDFWQSPLLSVHLLLHAVVAGAAALLILQVLYPDLAGRIREILLVGLLVNFMALMGECLFPHPTEDARAAARMIFRGTGAIPFWGGVVGAGHGLAAVLVMSGNSGLEAIGCLLILGGLFVAAHLWVTVPQRIPLS